MHCIRVPGHGKRLLEAIYAHAKANNMFEVTVESPAEGMTHVCRSLLLWFSIRAIIPITATAVIDSHPTVRLTPLCRVSLAVNRSATCWTWS